MMSEQVVKLYLLLIFVAIICYLIVDWKTVVKYPILALLYCAGCVTMVCALFRIIYGIVVWGQWLFS